MSFRYYSYHNRSLYGMIYEMEKVGDRIPRHSHAHPRTDEHNLICLRGGVKLVTDGFVHAMLAGSVYDFDSKIPHEIVATTPYAKILTLYINGKPLDFIEGFEGHM